MFSGGTNVDKPHGFRVIGSLTGIPATSKSYPVAAANTEMAPGDLVVMTNAGVVDKAAASAVQIVGVAQQHKDASSGGTMLICDDPMAILEAQTDNGTGTLTAQTGVNLNANIIATACSYGLSRMEIDENTGATTATLPLKIIGLYPAVDNEFGEFNRLVCIINNHVYKSVGVDGV